MEQAFEIILIKDISETKNNVYLIADKESKQSVIIDPACSISQISEIISKNELFLTGVLITHTHSDHIRSVDDLVNIYNCNVYVSKNESEYYFYTCNNIKRFEVGELINFGKTTVKCLLTPGHTFGSACFIFEGNIFTGDTLFIEGCGLCDPSGGSVISMYYSVCKIKNHVNDSTQVYPGHTYEALPGMAISYLKDNNIYYIIEDKDEFIEFRTRKNQTNLFDFK